MGYRVKLSKIKNGSALRTNEVEGDTDALPKVGKSFVMFAEPIVEGATGRLVMTSPVVEVVGSFGPVDQTPYLVLFDTENSTYRLDVLE